MNDRELNSGTACLAKIALLAVSVLGFAIAASGSLLAQEASGGTSSPPAQPAVAYLEYKEVSFSLSQCYREVSEQSGAFKKEPPFGRKSVTRGMLPLGGDGTNEMAFAWDRTAGVLYFDLNRNLDLTDDPAGVFTNDHRFELNYQSFTNVHVPMKTPAGTFQALVDLEFDASTVVHCRAELRSFWRGKVTLEGAEWQIGLVAHPFEQRAFYEGGHLLLRPWSEHNKPFSTDSGSLEALPFSQKVFVGNHAYQLRCTSQGHGEGAKVRIQFSEQRARLGELHIMGDFVRRLTLEGGAYMVVLDKPGAVAKVPVGSYESFRVCLRKGDAEAHLDEHDSAVETPIIITARTPAVLPAGGPLTNSVSIRTSGRHLLLNYQLVGAAGIYVLDSMDGLHPPEFTVYRGEKKVGSGKSEFG